MKGRTFRKSREWLLMDEWKETWGGGKLHVRFRTAAYGKEAFAWLKRWTMKRANRIVCRFRPEEPAAERERARDLSTHHHDELTDYILGAFSVCKMLFDRMSVSDRFPLFNYFTRTGVDDNTFDTVQWGQQTHAFREFMLKAKLRIQRFVLIYRLDPRASSVFIDLPDNSAISGAGSWGKSLLRFVWAVQLLPLSTTFQMVCALVDNWI